MIGWLQGELADPWQLDKRYGLQLRCHGVGYDVQVSHRQWLQLPAVGTPTALHIHASIREDASTLYGFSDRHERDRPVRAAPGASCTQAGRRFAGYPEGARGDDICLLASWRSRTSATR